MRRRSPIAVALTVLAGCASPAKDNVGRAEAIASAMRAALSRTIKPLDVLYITVGPWPYYESLVRIDIDGSAPLSLERRTTDLREWFPLVRSPRQWGGKTLRGVRDDIRTSVQHKIPYAWVTVEVLGVFVRCTAQYCRT